MCKNIARLHKQKRVRRYQKSIKTIQRLYFDVFKLDRAQAATAKLVVGTESGDASWKTVTGAKNRATQLSVKQAERIKHYQKSDAKMKIELEN